MQTQISILYVPRYSIRGSINQRSLQIILVKDLNMFPCKVQTVQQMLAVVRQAGVTYSQTILNLDNESLFIENRYMNKQNYRILCT